MHSTLTTDRFAFYKGSISAPCRSSLFGAMVILSALAALSLAMLSPERVGKYALAGFAPLIPMGVVSKSIHAVHLTLFGLLWILLLDIFPFFQIWPFRLLAPLTAYGVLVSIILPLRRSVGWLRIGHFGHTVRLLVIATIIISIVALAVWYFLAKPDLSSHLALMPEMPVWIFPVAALGFALINAAMEEVIFRGIMMEALDSAIGAGHMSVIVQAVSFAALHYLAGIPNGAWGFAMVLIYGVMLGAIRRQSQGIFAPWAAHVMADITIFGILAVILIKS